MGRQRWRRLTGERQPAGADPSGQPYPGQRQSLHWLALHGFVRGIASIGARGGDPQARLIADPAVMADLVPFYQEFRARGPLVRSRIGYLTADHGIAHELLRSDDFRVLSIGSNLPVPMRWLERRARDNLLHPLRPPSLLAVEPPDHTRYRKTVSSVFTPRAVAALRDRVEQTVTALLDQLADQPGVVSSTGSARSCRSRSSATSWGA